MRYMAIMALALGILTGATCIDKATGVAVDENGNRVVVPGAGIKPVVDVAKDVGAGTPVGWGAAGLSWLITIWQIWRTQTAKTALVSTATTIEDFLKSPAGKPFEDMVKGMLAKGHTRAGVLKYMESIVEKFGHAST